MPTEVTILRDDRFLWVGLCTYVLSAVHLISLFNLFFSLASARKTQPCQRPRFFTRRNKSLLYLFWIDKASAHATEAYFCVFVGSWRRISGSTHTLAGCVPGCIFVVPAVRQRMPRDIEGIQRPELRQGLALAASHYRNPFSRDGNASAKSPLPGVRRFGVPTDAPENHRLPLCTAQLFYQTFD